METSAINPTSIAPFVGRAFTVVGHPVELTLASVDEFDTGDSPYAAFSLLFEGPTDVHLAQGNWKLDCDGSEFALFLVPVGPQPSGRLGYEALFSRQL